LCVIAFAGGVFEAGLTSIIAAHGSQTGLSLAAAASIVAAIGVGSFLVQYPAGVLADRISARSVFSMAAVLLIGSALLLLLSGRLPLTLWLAALIWGGIGGALYTLSMIQVAHRFQGGDVAAGTASLITGYTLGGALGPAASGLMLDLAGVSGLGLWLAGLSMATLLAARRL
jgi:predicted MFS family arabinose efflux permease